MQQDQHAWIRQVETGTERQDQQLPPSPWAERDGIYPTLSPSTSDNLIPLTYPITPPSTDHDTIFSLGDIFHGDLKPTISHDDDHDIQVNVTGLEVTLYHVDEEIQWPSFPLDLGTRAVSDNGNSSALTHRIDCLPTIPSLLEAESDMLSEYYFSLICIINSGFDSPSNPFRAYVANALSHDSTIRHCMLSMSAAHLHQQNKDLKHMALAHRTEAISALRTEVSDSNRQALLPKNDGPRASSLLFGTLLLGMSSVS